MEVEEPAGRVFSIVAENRPVPGCTVSRAAWGGGGAVLAHFSLAAGTDIGAAASPCARLWVVVDGEIEAAVPGAPPRTLRPGDLFAAPARTPVGVRSSAGGVYSELVTERDTHMNPAIREGAVFALKDLLPYQPGRVVNMDVASGPNFKFALLAFDAGTGLSEHAAPGDALVFALEGDGVVGYEGRDSPIRAGQGIRFAGGGLHSIKAVTKFKMAILLSLG